MAPSATYLLTFAARRGSASAARASSGARRRVGRIAEDALQRLREAGAIIVDVERIAPADFGNDGRAVLLHEFKHDVKARIACNLSNAHGVSEHIKPASSAG